MRFTLRWRRRREPAPPTRDEAVRLLHEAERAKARADKYQGPERRVRDA